MQASTCDKKLTSSQIETRETRRHAAAMYIFILFHQTLVAIIHRTYIDVHIH